MQLEIPYHPLYREKKLQPSLDWDITNQLLEQFQSTKERIEQQQSDGYMVAVVHLSGDLTHTAHIAYMNTIKKKLQELWKPCKLVVGVEADSRTEQRKNKKNVFGQEERKYIFENLKVVDKAYIEFEGIDEQNNEARPCGIIQYLAPDVLVSHQEYIPIEDEKGIRERLQIIDSDLIVIQYDDQEKYWEQDFRVTHQRSTTNTIKQILALYWDHPKYK